MAKPIVSVVINALEEFISEQDHYLFRDFKDHNLLLLPKFRQRFKNIVRELETINSFLEDVDTMQDEDSVRKWVRDIRSLAYRSEDLVEKHAVNCFLFLKDRKPGIKGVLRNFIQQRKLSYFLQAVEGEILDIQKEIVHLGERFAMYMRLKKSEDESERFLRITLPQVDDECFVDINDELGRLVSVVINTGDEHKYVFLCGMGGTGKTTMARKIYNEKKVREEFQAFAWVCVTKYCKMRTIKVELLKQLTNRSDVWDIQEDILMADIQEVTQRKKCFVVIDDIWSNDHWEEIKSWFHSPQSQSRSKILLTTRIAELSHNGFRHHLRFFNETESFELFKKKVPAVVEDPSLEELGRQIVSKCGGLPLAIVALGGILRTKNSVHEWNMINNNFNSILAPRFGDGDSVLRRLGLSYDDLPHFLKPCFLYMSISGYDHHPIDLMKLYQLWIAEGMVPRSRQLDSEQTSMDVAERFLKELISRGMVEGKVDQVLGRWSTCHLHSMMRDLCLKKAQQEEFFFVKDMDYPNNISVGSNVRRLAIKSYKDELVVQPIDHLTSPIIRALSLSCVQQAEVQTVDASVLKKCKLLRVLDFEGYSLPGKELLDEIGMLFHLRYLSLRNCDVTEFPSSVGDLPLLLTLDLRTTTKIMIHRNVFSTRRTLKHLYLNKFHCGPRGKLLINGLTELESFILGETVSDVELKHLSYLVNIRHFEVDNITNENDFMEIMAQIRSWKKIKLLKVGILDLGGETPDRRLFESINITDLKLIRISTSRLLHANVLCSNLVSLDIVSCRHVDHAFIELLGTFPKLRKLSCSASDRSIRELNFCVEGLFAEVRSLELYDFVGLKIMKVAEGSLPKLITLRVGGCENLEIQPEDGFKFINKLREIGIEENSMVGFKKNFQRFHSRYDHILIKDL